MEIFLESNRNKFSRDEAVSLNVNLESTKKILPGCGEISSVLSLYEQYNLERDNCEKYRFIFTINPVCTNALYNVKTEVVIKEGTDDCKFLNLEESVAKPTKAINTTGPVTLDQCLDDTEYSHPDFGGFVYHCGMDIFKNHRLRTTGFNFFKEPKTSNTDGKKVFNTMKSLVIDKNGESVSERLVLVDNNQYNSTQKTKIHTYTMDNTVTMIDAYSSGVREVDGWYGFYNVGNINIANNLTGDTEVNLNRVINNNKQCEFIDFYPDRSLFSFIPKVNKVRKRLEKNWDYCITYPAESDSGCLATWGVTDDNGGIQISSIESGRTDAGNYVVSFRTVIPHGLSPKDNVSLTVSLDGTTYSRFKCRVVSIGDYEGKNSDVIFTIRYYDISALDLQYEDTGDSKTLILVNGIKSASFKRMSNGIECSYYARKLRKLGNFRSECNKIVGGKNIYGDKFAQIVFTDDIDVPFTGLKTNMGTPLTDLYLTIVKRNAGNYLFYNGSGQSEDVEFSHCFGKVTSGVKLPGSVENYNIYKIHNIPDETGNTPSVIEDDITINNDTFFYDIVEFDSSTMTERQLDMVYHRFNTYQREFTGDTCGFKDPITWDYIYADDYTPNEAGTGLSGFTISSDTIGTKDNPINLMPEGYFYQHSYKIKIREESEPKNSRLEKLIDGPSVINMNEGLSADTIPYIFPYAIPCEKDFGLIKGTELCLVRTDGSARRVVFQEYTDGYIFLSLVTIDDSLTTDNYAYLYRLTEYCPEYATFNPRLACLTWRDIVPLSELNVDSDLYNFPFSNGALYKHVNVNFFLQRQDPHNEYGLRDRNSEIIEFIPEWEDKMDLSEVTVFYNNLGNICF